MRTVIIIDNGEAQIDMIPETDADKVALAMMPVGTMLRVGKAKGYATAAGRYMRPYGDDDAVQFTYATTVPHPELDPDFAEVTP